MWLLFLLFIVLPIAELYVIIQIGGAIGVLPTLALLVVDSLVGAALARSQSRAAWERFNRALAEGRVPGREVFDGAMIILGGALLLTPGFLTDIVGLVLLLPPTRAVRRGVPRPLRLRSVPGSRGASPAGPARPASGRAGATRSRARPRLRLRGQRARGDRAAARAAGRDRSGRAAWLTS